MLATGITEGTLGRRRAPLSRSDVVSTPTASAVDPGREMVRRKTLKRLRSLFAVEPSVYKDEVPPDTKARPFSDP